MLLARRQLPRCGGRWLGGHLLRQQRAAAPLPAMTTPAAAFPPASTVGSSGGGGGSRPTSSVAPLDRPRRDGKERVVILGSGWGGFEAARKLDPKLYDVTLVSPANHKVFTPMLASSATGYIDFQSISEPVRTLPGLTYHQAKARGIDLDKQLVQCSDMFRQFAFSVPYDRLLIAVGCKTHTYNTPGVAEHEGEYVFFLKHLHHARQIKNRIIECFERADLPGVSPEERTRLLSFVVVGGGPTSCEFAADLHDFVRKDISRVYPDLVPSFSLHVVEASDHILGSFDEALQSYAMRLLSKRRINVLLNSAVVEVVEETAEEQARAGHQNPFAQARLSTGEVMPVGCMVWSAGLQNVKLINALQELPRHPNGRLKIDERLQVEGQEGRVWALGDCAMSGQKGLPPIAQAAMQQGAYFAKALNQAAKAGDGRGPAYHANKDFQLFGMGSMANLGIGQGIYDVSSADPKLVKFFKTVSGGSNVIAGPLAWVMWKGGYWILRQVSWRNRVLIPMQWIKTWLFGRDMTRFF